MGDTRMTEPIVTEYNDTDAMRCDDYIVLPKTTNLSEVIRVCVEAGSHGFARGSNTQGRGQFYIRSPHRTVDLLNTKLFHKKNVSFFIVEY